MSKSSKLHHGTSVYVYACKKQSIQSTDWENFWSHTTCSRWRLDNAGNKQTTAVGAFWVGLASMSGMHFGLAHGSFVFPGFLPHPSARWEAACSAAPACPRSQMALLSSQWILSTARSPPKSSRMSTGLALFSGLVLSVTGGTPYIR